MNKTYIGVDPDVDKSGFAISEVIDGKRQYKTLSMNFFEAYNYFVSMFWNSENPAEFKAYVECGYMNRKNNYHNRVNQSKVVGERIANNVGRNEQMQRLYVQMFEFMGISVVKCIPKLTKKDKEYTLRATGIKPKNQEEVDALWLIYGLN